MALIKGHKPKRARRVQPDWHLSPQEESVRSRNPLMFWIANRLRWRDEELPDHAREERNWALARCILAPTRDIRDDGAKTRCPIWTGLIDRGDTLHDYSLHCKRPDPARPGKVTQKLPDTDQWLFRSVYSHFEFEAFIEALIQLGYWMALDETSPRKIAPRLLGYAAYSSRDTELARFDHEAEALAYLPRTGRTIRARYAKGETKIIYRARVTGGFTGGVCEWAEIDN